LVLAAQAAEAVPPAHAQRKRRRVRDEAHLCKCSRVSLRKDGGPGKFKRRRRACARASETRARSPPCACAPELCPRACRAPSPERLKAQTPAHNRAHTQSRRTRKDSRVRE
jgi:hypothetical protein